MMQRRFSPWMPALGLALVASLIPGRVDGAELSKYIPASANAVVHINVCQILDSAVVKKYALVQVEAMIKQKAEAQKVLTQIGLDPLKDVSSITIAGPGSQTIENKWTIIVHGNFDLAKIEDAVASNKDANVKTSKESGITIYEMQNPRQPQLTFAAFLDKHTAVASASKDTIVDDIAINAGKKTPASNKQLADLVSTLGDKQSLWLAGLLSQEVKDMLANNPQMKDIAADVESISGGVTLTNGIKANFHINTASPKAAAKIHKMLNGIPPVIQLLLAGNEQLKEVAPLINDALEGVKFSEDNNAAVIQVTISADLIDRAAKLKDGQK